MSEMPISVVIVDDHALVREGTRRIFERFDDIEVIGEAASAEAALADLDRREPDVVLVDIHLPGMNGIELARTVADRHPRCRVVMLTAFGDRDYVHAALAAGACGFLLKTSPGEELAEAVRSAATGTTYVGADVVTGGGAAQAAVDRAGLTEREMEILLLVAEGMSNKAIASRLQISRRTVEGHISRVFAKVGAASRTELLRYAVENRLVQLGRDS